jgi:hypothetical protein
MKSRVASTTREGPTTVLRCRLLFSLLSQPSNRKSKDLTPVFQVLGSTARGYLTSFDTGNED